MRVGELEIAEGTPAKLIKACVALSAMHELFDALVPVKYPGRSKDSCILSALTARDFLQRIGFADAKVAPVYVMIRAWKEGREVHSVCVGDHDRVRPHVILPESPTDHARHGPTGKGWDGHLVVEVPSAAAFIDATAYQLQRPHWPSMPGIVCAPIDSDGVEVFPGMPALGLLRGDEADGTEVFAGWIRQPWNQRWKQAPDAVNKAMRKPVVAALHQHFGKWRDAA